jgi:hypothetical protein
MYIVHGHSYKMGVLHREWIDNNILYWEIVAHVSTWIGRMLDWQRVAAWICSFLYLQGVPPQKFHLEATETGCGRYDLILVGGLTAFNGGLIGSNGNLNCIWLVVFQPLWKMMDFVSWDDEHVPIWWEK